MNYVIPRILNRLKVLERVNITVSSTVNKKRMAIPIVKKIGYNNLFLSEMWMVQLLTRLFELKSGAFIDIGTNLGQSLIKVKSVDPEIPYIGFEPNPTCVFYMQELIKQNHFSNTRVLPVGISNKSGVVQLNFFHNGTTDSSASIVPEFRPDQKVTRTEFVPVQRFESLEEDLDLKDVTVIKIDVEGAELEVMEGVKSLLQTFRPFVLCEILPAYTSDNTVRTTRQKTIESLLNDVDYKLFRILKENNHSTSTIQLQAVDGFGIHDRIDWCDYVFSPVELAHQLNTFSQVANT